MFLYTGKYQKTDKYTTKKLVTNKRKQLTRVSYYQLTPHAFVSAARLTTQ